MFFVLGALGVMSVAALVVAVLAWSTVNEWVKANTNSKSKFAGLIKERMKDGTYKVVSGVFEKKWFRNKAGKRQTMNAWEVERIDSDLEELFDGQDQVIWQLD